MGAACCSPDLPLNSKYNPYSNIGLSALGNFPAGPDPSAISA